MGCWWGGGERGEVDEHVCYIPCKITDFLICEGMGEVCLYYFDHVFKILWGIRFIILYCLIS